MLRYLKWTFWTLLATFVVLFFNYTLPDRDVVRIVGTEIQRIDFGENSVFWAQPDTGSATNTGSRDVRFINAVAENGAIRVYRNEDTGWGWPPYFKLDSSNLHTEAQDLISTSANPQWVVVTHYGWRAELFSAFPNAIAVRPVASPDVQLIPYFNIGLILVLLALVWWIWRLWDRFHQARIEPIVDGIAIAIDNADERADSFRDRMLAKFRRKRI
jgi:hypothetical protein